MYLQGTQLLTLYVHANISAKSGNHFPEILSVLSSSQCSDF